MDGSVITDWGAAVMTSLTAALSLFLAAIPRVFGFLVILVIGWLIAGVLAAAVAALLRAVRFNDLAQRSGLAGFVHNMGVRTDPAGVLADIVKWFVRLIVLVVAFDALGLPAVSSILQQFLLWIPNLVVAVVVLVIAGLAANALGDLIRGSAAQAGFDNPDLFATIARVAIWGFGIVIAVNQIGIAQTLVNTLFMAAASLPDPRSNVPQRMWNAEPTTSPPPVALQTTKLCSYQIYDLSGWLSGVIGQPEDI